MQGVRSIALAVVLAGAGSSAHAQVVTNPNQIRGEIRFTNVAPEVVSILEAQGISEGDTYSHSVSASGVAPNDELSASQSLAPVAGPIAIPYELTVESSAAGIEYVMHGHVFLNDDVDAYWLLRRPGPVVFAEPAPDALFDYHECAAIIRLHFVDEMGTPHEAPGGQVDVRPTNLSSTYAQTYLARGSSEEIIVTPSQDATVLLFVQMFFGSHRDLDSFRIREMRTVSVACDEITEVEIEVPAGGGGGALAEVTGEFDLVGIDELHQGNPRVLGQHFTDIRVGSGPFGNIRNHHIDAQPSSGAYRLPNVLPSDYVEPPVPYSLVSVAAFGSHASFGSIATPGIPVAPSAGETLDLGGLLVMTPGWLSGDVLITGPPAPEGAVAPLATSLDVADFDIDGDGVPETGTSDDFSLARTRGLDGGQTAVAIEPIYSASTGALRGRYRTPLVTLNDGRPDAEWEFHQLDLKLDSLAARLPGTGPESHVDEYLQIDEDAPPVVLATPHLGHTWDLAYCTSTLYFRFVTTDGLLHRPSLGASGGFVGVDAWGREAAYSSRVSARGTPTAPEDAAPEGLIVAALVQGTHSLRPIVSVGPIGGPASQVTLSPIDLTVGCRELVEIGQDLQLQLDLGLEPCGAEGPVTVEGRVFGAELIRRIWYTVNGGAPVDACTDCGVDPLFSFGLSLGDGESIVRVVAEDELGRQASVTSYTRSVVEPSAVDRRPNTEPLRVRKLPDSPELTVSWESMAFQPSILHVGTIESLWNDRVYDHESLLPCGLSDHERTGRIDAPRAYMLVSSDCGHGESSLGRDSLGVERPPSEPGCP